ncbi:hypothetical protein K438DRAFT_1960669 [Mycena galopus ATCC 62051]|nr:hypothetical protein K438DRAFT_1960669 [Mycena galopus ATCC 62051]
MSTSTRKDRSCVFIMRNTPPALFQDPNFIPQYGQFSDGFLKLPAFQRYILKHQLLYPNDRIQEQVQALEFEQALPNMWIRFECENLENATEFLLDEEIRALHARSVLEGAGGYVFTATSKTRVNVPFTGDRVCASVVIKIPPGVDSDAFHAAMDVMFDKIVALPVFQKNTLSHTYWRIDQSNKIAHYIPGLEHPEPEIVIVLAEFGSMDTMIESLGHPVTKATCDEGFKQFPGVRIWGCSMDVITKIDKL